MILTFCFLSLFFCLSRNYLFLPQIFLFLTEPEVFEPKAIKHTKNTELTLRVPFVFFLPQMTQITQIFLSLFFWCAVAAQGALQINTDFYVSLGQHFIAFFAIRLKTVGSLKDSCNAQHNEQAWINFVEIAIAQQLKQVLLFSLKRNFLLSLIAKNRSTDSTEFLYRTDLNNNLYIEWKR